MSWGISFQVRWLALVRLLWTDMREGTGKVWESCSSIYLLVLQCFWYNITRVATEIMLYFPTPKRCLVTLTIEVLLTAYTSYICLKTTTTTTTTTTTVRTIWQIVFGLGCSPSPSP